MESVDYQNLEVKNVFGLLYGGSGTGKTHFAGTIGEFGYVLVVDVDKGCRTLKTAKDLKPFWNNIEVTTFSKFKDLNQLYALTYNNDPAEWSKALGKTITRKFDWIVIDTWSEVQWYLMQQRRLERSLGGTETEKLEFRKNIEIQDWGALTDLNKLSIEKFRECPDINILFTMQEGITQDKNTSQTFKGPAIHGKLVHEVPAYFEIVIHSFNDITGKWGCTTLPKGGWPAKTRFGEGASIINPTAKQFFVGL